MAGVEAQFGSFLLLAASGFFQAAFALPVRHVRGWRWEQLWVAQSVAANVLFPLAASTGALLAGAWMLNAG